MISDDRRLVRLPGAGRIAGICAGIAAYLDTDVVLIRVLWVVLSIIPGGIVGGLIAYLAVWLIMPASTQPEPVVRAQLTRSRARTIAGVCGGIAEHLRVDPTVVRVGWVILTIVPGAIVLGVLAYLAAWLIIPEAPIAAGETAPHAA